MKADREKLLFRALRDTLKHFGSYSIHSISPYLFGYDESRREMGLPAVPSRLDKEAFSLWQQERVPVGSRNLQAYCDFLTTTEVDALEVYYLIVKGALKELGTVEGHSLIDLNSEYQANNADLLGFLQHEQVRSRPAMYFGNYSWLSGLEAYCKGFLWAEKDCGLKDSKSQQLVSHFQKWRDKRYPPIKGKGFAKQYYFLEISQERAWELFFEDLDYFIDGRAADATPQWILDSVASAQRAQQLANRNRTD